GLFAAALRDQALANSSAARRRAEDDDEQDAEDERVRTDGRVARHGEGAVAMVAEEQASRPAGAPLAPFGSRRQDEGSDGDLRAVSR
ncbi:MAG: hypothetical protein M3P93_07145, partial [Actinomycetota bacterium]|nr:hypothetical protein [Actinomycetota bacterium]